MNDNLLPATGGTLTGPITVPYGNTGGIHIGGSGPQILSGTGSPEGVVTAPVGSTWRDTNATTGAVKWIKASGAGNTGWKVEYGDTGWRNISTLIDATWDGAKFTYVRRVGSNVHLGLSITKSTNLGALVTYPVWTPASGFSPYNGLSIFDGVAFLADTSTFVQIFMRPAIEARCGVTAGAGVPVRGTFSFPTNDAWPTVLPGTAA